MQSAVAYSLNHDTHNNIIWAPTYPNFLEFGPHLHRYNSVKVHPYAHPQLMALMYFIYADICYIYMTNPLLRYILIPIEVLVEGQSLVKPNQSLVQSLVQKKHWLWGVSRQRSGHYFSTKLYRDHIESYLSGFGYSELVQGQFEKWHFFLWTPYYHFFITRHSFQSYPTTANGSGHYTVQSWIPT